MSKNLSRLVIVNDIVMILLALLSGYLLLLSETTTLTPEQLIQFDKIDLFIAYIFLADFFALLYLSSDRKKFFKTRWWELLAAIPITSDPTQALRLLRLFRIVRLFRLIAHVEAIREDVIRGNKIHK